MNTQENTAETLLKSTDLFAYLDKRHNEQKAKADSKRREQRDAQLMAEMHDECKYVIENIIDKVKALEAEYHKENATAQTPPDSGAKNL